MLHLNVPYPEESWLRTFVRKFFLLCVAIVIPEYIACMAGGQWAAAMRSVRAMHVAGNEHWTIMHGFYAEMGGFVLEDGFFPPFPVTTAQICYLARNQYIDLPSITKEDIQDKGKADTAFKAVAVFQTGWVVLQIIGRVAERLPMSLLELETCAIVGCSLFTFYFWFHKPMDVGQPTKLKTKTSIAKILIRAGDEASKPYQYTPLDFVECFDTLTGYFGPRQRPIPRISEDRDVLADTPWMHFLFNLPFIPIIVIHSLAGI